MSEPYYQDDFVTLYCGDNRAVLAALALECVDHLLTDPPYEAEAHAASRRAYSTGGGVRLDGLPFAALDESGRRGFAQIVSPLVQRWALTFCQVEAAMAWRVAYEEQGLKYCRTGIYAKRGGAPMFAGMYPAQSYECIVLAWAGRGAPRWNGGGSGCIWSANPQVAGDGPRHHPTQKPLALLEQLVALFTDPGELILDPYAGAGSVGVAAKRLGRRAILIEQDPTYCAAAAARLARAQADMTISPPAYAQAALTVEAPHGPTEADAHP